MAVIHFFSQPTELITGFRTKKPCRAFLCVLITTKFAENIKTRFENAKTQFENAETQ